MYVCEVCVCGLCEYVKCVCVHVCGLCEYVTCTCMIWMSVCLFVSVYSVCPPQKGDPRVRGTALVVFPPPAELGLGDTLPSVVAPQNPSLEWVVWLERASPLSVPSICEESC